MTRTSTDLLRLLAMACVVFIHASAQAEERFRPACAWLSADGLAVAINQLGRFCVPLFVVLSGYGLMARQLSGKVDRTLFFYQERAGRIVLPYLAWSLALLLIDGAWGDWSRLGLALLTGGAEYHLYFLVLILGCYLFFPLLARCVDGRLTLLLLLPLLPALWPIPDLLGRWAPPHLPAWAPSAWLFWFHLGMVLARRDRERPATAGLFRRLLALSLLLAAGAALLAEYAYQAGRLPDPGWYNHFHRVAVLAWSLAVLWAWRCWDAQLSALAGTWGKAIALAAGLSFLVYLGHTRILSAWRHSPLDGHTFALFTATLACAIPAAWLAHRLIPWAWPRKVLGLP